MRKIFLAAVLLLALTACSAPKVAETAVPTQVIESTPVLTPTPILTSEVGLVLTKSFQICGEDVTVTVRDGARGTKDTVTIERDGVEPQVFNEENLDGGYAPEIIVEDMNFDGNLDFRFRSIAMATGTDRCYCYLWNGTEQKFERAEELNELSSLSFYPETETVRSYDRSSCFEEYTVLRWQGNTLAYLRRWRFGREFWPEEKTWDYAYRVWDHDPTAPPLDRDEASWVEVAVWPPAVLEADWEKAKEEADRWLDPAYYGEDIKTPHYIPTDLTDYLTALLEQGETYDALDHCIAFLDSYRVNYNEGNAFDIWKERVWSEGWEGGMLAGVGGYMVDVDNDGTEDALVMSDQGTGHFTTLYFLRGLKNGEYENSLSVPFNRCNWWACISWKGTHYLISLAEANWIRRFTGINVYLLKDGAVQDRIFLSMEQVNWHVTENSAEPGNEGVAEHLMTVGPDAWAEFAKSGKQHVGTAERYATAAEVADLTDEWLRPENFYMCDWNGDGIEERYSKFDGGCTATGRALNTSLDIVDLNKDGLAQMIWFDRVGGETLLIRASNFGDEPVRMSALRRTATGWESIARATIDCGREVTRYRWTQGENIDFKTANWNWAWTGDTY